MKKPAPILLLILLIAALTTCKKEPDAPIGGNKIEMDETTTDSVAYFMAKVSTKVSSTGGNEISQHGFCWSTEKEPTTKDNKTTLGKLEKPGLFSSEITGLENNTTYYIRSYLTYQYGIVYGSEQNIHTLKTGIPVVDTTTVSNVTLYSAEFSGVVAADSGLSISTRGFCWDTTANCTVDSSIDTTINGKGLGSFTSKITTLNEGVDYFARAYAINGKGISYGEVKQFSTIPITVPEVNTTDITEITINSAKSGGNVSSSGNGTVTARGVVWSTSENPTVENNAGLTTNGSGTGIFSSNLINLQDGFTYYVRAYASNEKSTAYGLQKSFQTTAIGAPNVITTTITSITVSSAQGGGNVTDSGNGTVTSRGVCWNTSGNPTLENNMGFTTDGSGTGIFTSSIIGLSDGITFYVVAYATNETSTGYGEVKQFTTIPITLPIVVTADAIEITINSAICGGNVTSDGNSTVIYRGLCWNTTGNPTLENNTGFTDDGNGIGSFISNIIDLTDNTTYFVAAYATNEKGTYYGEVLQFTTLTLDLSSVLTNEVTNIRATSATCGGNVTDEGNGTVTARGVCWNISGNPTLDDNIGFTSDGSGTGSFISSITGLSEYTTYYVTAYAINELGNSYGQEKTFLATNDFTDPRDGQTYKTVNIGDQIWFAENLNYQTSNSWWYDYSSANGDIYGRLYRSDAAPSACPNGWHLPSDEEWKTLEMHIGLTQVEADQTGWRGNDEGEKLKSTSGWNYDGNGTDAVGFAALPGGSRGITGDFSNLGDFGFWWSATEYGTLDVWSRTLFYNNNGVYRDIENWVKCFSVRCIKD